MSTTTTIPGAAPKKKRNRIPLSCTICRKRKVKCDKTRPHCNQCTKTGVAHLCHYMEQNWAQDAKKEISKDNELKNLKERCKILEEKLARYMHNPAVTASLGASVVNSPVGLSSPVDAPIKLTNSPMVKLEDDTNMVDDVARPVKEHDYDELDLTRQFDLLHIKSNGTIHLGATHWLAIMKGDPYLKLLWTHIFTMREKLLEYYTNGSGHKRRKRQKNGGKCPIDHSKFKAAESEQKNHFVKTTPMVNDTPKSSIGKCPIDHRAMSNPVGVNSNTGQFQPMHPPHTHIVQNKCPVDHKVNDSNLTSTNTDNKNAATKKCPIDHSKYTKEKMQGAGLNDKPLTKQEVIEKLCQLLPPKRIIMLYIDKFFKHFYPVIPILDELNFKNNINQIFDLNSLISNTIMSTSSDLELEPITSMTLNKPTDYSNLGILIIIMRLVWLSLPMNSCKIDIENPLLNKLRTDHDFKNEDYESGSLASSLRLKDELQLLKYEVDGFALDLVKKHLIKFDEISSISNTNVNMSTIQFAVFFKFYLMNCANASSQGNSAGNFDNESHQILLSSIMMMAFSCGLHRDPDNFPQLNVVSANLTTDNTRSGPPSNSNRNGSETPSVSPKDTNVSIERAKHTWRKVWYYIVSLDVQQSLLLGSPRLIRNLNDISDTKLPSASKIDYVKDIKELIIIKNYTLFYQLDLCIVAVLNHTLNISIAKNVRKFELDALISNLQKLTDGEKGINDVINSLINHGLLSTSEVPIGLQKFDDIYDLPRMEDILLARKSEQEIVGDENERIGQDVDKKLDLPHEMTSKALFFSKHMTLRMLLYLLNYILFTHYEPLGAEDPTTTILAKNYAQKALDYALDGYRNCMLYFVGVSDQNPLFKYMNVILCFHSLDIGHRALQFIICLILRVKCGPLNGLKETQTIFGTSVPSSCNSSSVEDENTEEPNNLNQDNQFQDDLMQNINLDNSDSLAEKLMSRMVLFKQLTEKLAPKYSFSVRVMKSTGFFISLLTTPSGSFGSKKNGSKHKHGVGKLLLSNWKHPKISNIPALLSSDSDQLKKCPVYQDALGFMPSRPSVTNLPSISNVEGLLPNAQANGRMTPQLPPIRSYQPITYSSSHMRVTPNSESDARKLGPDSHQVTNPLIPSPLSPANQQQNQVNVLHMHQQRSMSPAPMPMMNPTAMTTNQNMIPERKYAPHSGAATPILPGTNSDIQQQTQMTRNDPYPTEQFSLPPISSAKNNMAWGTTPESEQGDHLTPNTTTSSLDTPDFEDFIIQNSNFNGLLINPNSLAEAMGSLPSGRDGAILNVNSFKDFTTSTNDKTITPNSADQTDLFSVDMASTDFLPIDNFAIDGFMDSANLDIGSIWE
ncbi:related to Heme-responsive zinc finger transcription factor HAP1 [Nakaseomyces glabratus]|nr:Zn(2)-C6 fungal-type DNA-binding domain signature [Nakaseomyces glabratus]QNG12454.1 uncharacterized protein GWK60_B03245 [Nakaseomyces glabratus]SCV14707.1 related to Heme-responsive zinc finger transcription factor HAP1 [Nakaseomyces glabratus]SLM13512.1 related to Heme-responsive zinc finger transcription factor HAP1 [Nakaseomyces glabratus]